MSRRKPSAVVCASAAFWLAVAISFSNLSAFSLASDASFCARAVFCCSPSNLSLKSSSSLPWTTFRRLLTTNAPAPKTNVSASSTTPPISKIAFHTSRDIGLPLPSVFETTPIVLAVFSLDRRNFNLGHYQSSFRVANLRAFAHDTLFARKEPRLSCRGKVNRTLLQGSSHFENDRRITNAQVRGHCLAEG